MSDEAPPKKDEGGGAPAWVMTFADLMSLLMCFFVLLLSFAEMDLLKFKQIAGSLKAAFGVQREIKVKEMPKGTSIIAQEFSPGKPTPTLVQDIRQQTIDETKQTLQFTDATTEKDGDGTADDADNQKDAPVQTEQTSDVVSETELDQRLQSLYEIVTELNENINKVTEDLNKEISEEEKEELENATAKAAIIEQEIEELLRLKKEQKLYAEVSNEEAIKQTQADAQKLLQALAPEIEKGLVSIDTENNKILLRIKEKGSFPSGSSDLKGGFIPVIDKLKGSLDTIDGKILIAGHTDNIPIKTARFRSNWELSSSRAVTVAHSLLEDSSLNPKRFSVEGHGATKPIVRNNTAENRALNRRVELTIIQGERDQLEEFPLEGEKPEGETENIEETVHENPQQTNLAGAETLKNRLGSISEGSNNN